MATKKTNSQSVNNQYAAVANYANEVFQTMIAAPADEVRMTASQVAKALFKSLFFSADSNDKYKEQHTIEAEGMTLTTTPCQVFAQLADLESMLKIKKADRMTFVHAYELLKPEQVEASCFIPADVATICKYADTSELRPVMNGVCFDFEHKALVASDGHVLLAVPMQATTGDTRWIVPTKFLEAHAGQIIQFTTIDGLQYAYVCQERTRLIEGRYPNWRTVVPKLDTAPIHIGSAWKEFVEKCSMLGKVNGATNMVTIEGRSYSKTITIIGSNPDFGTEQKAEVCIDGEIPYDFRIGMKGTSFRKFPPFTDMYLKDCSRAAVFTDGVCVLLQMPMMIVDEDGKPVNVTANWTATTIKKTFVPEVMKEPVKAEEAKPEPVCETPKNENEMVNGESSNSKCDEPVCVNPEPKVIAIGTEVCVKGDESGTVYVIEMLSEQRAILKGVSDPTKRRVEKRENLQTLSGSPLKGEDLKPETTKPETVETTEPVSSSEAVTPSDSDNSENSEQSDNSVKLGAVYVCSYSEKAVLVFGDTKKYRKALKKYGTWIAKYEGWCLSKKRIDYVKKTIGDKLQETTTMPEAKVSTKKAA